MKRFKTFFCPVCAVAAISLMAACSNGGDEPAGITGQEEAQMKAIQISSPGFEADGPIPQKYSCDGDDVSPPLVFGDVPEDAASLALIIDDPDAPVGTWVHWVVYDINPTTAEFPESVTADGPVPGNGVQGKNSWNRNDYGGPCPPRGTHRYFFKLYALDTRLSLAAGVDKEKLLEAMEGHVLAQGQLMGTYSR